MSRWTQPPNRKLLAMAAARYRWSERAVGLDNEPGRILAKIPPRHIQPEMHNCSPKPDGLPT